MMVFIKQKVELSKYLVLLFFILICNIIITAQSFSGRQLWNIGVSDNSISEFALAPNDYNEFVPSGFGGANRYFVIGESVTKEDFPYLLPGPKDPFSGYGYWAGLALNKLPIYFEITSLPMEGECVLSIDFLAVNSQQAPLFRCTVNGINYEHQLKKGTSKSPDKIEGNPQKISFALPVSVLKQGINEVVLQNMTGNWCAFDAIAFYGPSILDIKAPGPTLLHKVEFADREQEQEGKRSLPLRIDVRHSGKKTKIKAVVDGVALEQIMEAGHAILEFPFPAVDMQKASQVQVFVGSILKYDAKLNRNPAPLVQPTDYVNQFMGTSGSRWMIAPGPWMPMGMVKIAPENEDSQWKAGYEYQIENVMGFSHLHEWTMAGLLMMPTNGPCTLR